jgi:hypothetical protein
MKRDPLAIGSLVILTPAYRHLAPEDPHDWERVIVGERTVTGLDGTPRRWLSVRAPRGRTVTTWPLSAFTPIYQRRNDERLRT